MHHDEWPATEEWRAIDGYDDWYEVSDQGRVRSWVTRGYSRRRESPKLLKHSRDSEGRLHVMLCRSADYRTYRIHQLVAAAFIGPRPDGYQTCHNDGNPSNNALGNLRYDTVSGNQLDKLKHGTMPQGTRHHNSKLNGAAATEIRRRSAAGEGNTELGKAFGVTQSTVYAVVRRKTWKHVA